MYYKNLEELKKLIVDGKLITPSHDRDIVVGFDIVLPGIDIEANNIFAHRIDVHNIEAHHLDATNIKAYNIKALNINAHDIRANNIKAHDISAYNINSYGIRANNIKAHDIDVYDIEAKDITAYNIHVTDIRVDNIKASDVHRPEYYMKGKIMQYKNLEELKNMIREFLTLPPESLPGATWVDALGDSGSPWQHLRDWILPDYQQRLNHLGETVLLSADRDGWRDGVTVTLD